MPDSEGLSKVHDLFTTTFLKPSAELNIVDIIMKRGFLESGRRECVDHHEAAIVLLAKIASTFPDAMTALWSDDLASRLSQLVKVTSKARDQKATV